MTLGMYIGFMIVFFFGLLYLMSINDKLGKIVEELRKK